MNFVKTMLAITCAIMTFQVSAEQGVARSSFTSAIANHEPTDEITTLATDANKIYYFTEIKGLKGQTVTHRWEQNGEVQASVNFAVGGNRWRVWSSKNLESHLTGDWQVMVVDEAGNVLSQNSFSYGDTPAAATTEVTATEAPAQATEMSDTAVSTSDEAAPAATQNAPISEEELSKIAPAAGGETTMPAAKAAE